MVEQSHLSRLIELLEDFGYKPTAQPRLGFEYPHPSQTDNTYAFHEGECLVQIFESRGGIAEFSFDEAGRYVGFGADYP